MMKWVRFEFYLEWIALMLNIGCYMKHLIIKAKINRCILKSICFCSISMNDIGFNNEFVVKFKES